MRLAVLVACSNGFERLARGSRLLAPAARRYTRRSQGAIGAITRGMVVYQQADSWYDRQVSEGSNTGSNRQ